MLTPSKFFFMMKLTTPATASAPYTAEAPPVRMSTRSTSEVGTKFRSAATAEIDEVGLPPISRRPSISTRVRAEPRPRRLTVAVPLEPLETLEPCAAKDCGRELIRSSIRLTPRALMSAEVTEVTGATLVRFGVGIRVPVTTISETSPDAAAAAEAWVADRPRKATPQIIEEANRRSRVEFIFKVYILQRSPRKADQPPNNVVPGSQSSPVTAELRAYQRQGQRTLAFGNVSDADLSHSGHRLCRQPSKRPQFTPSRRNPAKCSPPRRAIACATRDGFNVGSR